MLESDYQSGLIKRLVERFKGCYILKNDPKKLQGVPDLLMLYGNWWGMLEVKPSKDADHEPNQDYYIEVFDVMSFASFIYPENETEVFDAIQRSIRDRGETCIFEPEPVSLAQLR
jgi:hypothetical protein